MKQYIGIAVDVSASMLGLRAKAMDDLNQNIEAIKTAALKSEIDTIVSIVEFGSSIKRTVVNSSVHALRPVTKYRADEGSTRLLDAVGELAELMQQVPDKDEKDVSFLLMIITDGGENASKKWYNTLQGEIARLTKTDRWTFTFRVPKGNLAYITQFGIPAGNVMEWEQTESGFEFATQSTLAATQSYFAARSAGERSVKNFYANLGGVKPQEVRTAMEAVTGKFKIYQVKSKDDGASIRDFVEKKHKSYVVGAAFYQLTKSENVQGHKKIAIRTRESGAIYCGDAARDFLGIPKNDTCKLKPGDHGKFDIFVQSTSTNRKLVGGTDLLYSPELA